MFCKYCGKEIEEGSVFCEYCGKRQEEEAPKTQEVFHIEKRPEVQRKSSGSGKGKGRIAILVVLIVVVAGVLLWIKKPWENIGKLRKPTKIENQDRQDSAKKPKKPGKETSREKSESEENEEKSSVNKNPAVKKEPEEGKIRTEDVTRPMTPVEIAKESSFFVSSPPQAVHIDWIDDSSVKVTVAHYDPGQFDQRPPEWKSERWIIDTAYMTQYASYEDTVELFTVNEDGLYTFARMKFNMNGNEIEDVTFTQFNEDGSVYDEGTVDYWPD